MPAIVELTPLTQRGRKLLNELEAKTGLLAVQDQPCVGGEDVLPAGVGQCRWISGGAPPHRAELGHASDVQGGDAGRVAPQHDGNQVTAFTKSTANAMAPMPTTAASSSPPSPIKTLPTQSPNPPTRQAYCDPSPPQYTTRERENNTRARKPRRRRLLQAVCLSPHLVDETVVLVRVGRCCRRAGRRSSSPWRTGCRWGWRWAPS